MALSLQRYSWSSDGSKLNQILKERIIKERETSPVVESRNAELLHGNLIIEILSWLPVKALLQFKIVCKLWCDIISSPHFISKHLENYYNNNDSWRGCLLALFNVSQAELRLFELLINETPRVIADEELYKIPMKMYVCGPSDGIYYVYTQDAYADRDPRGLWNPATNELKVLPPLIMKPNLPSNLRYMPFEFYGFGLNPVTKDFKVVVIEGYSNFMDEDDKTKYPLSVFVYSLRSDSWKYWGDLAQAYVLEENTCYMCLNGCLYWLGSCDWDADHEVIISFDMSIDTCKEIHVPNFDKPASNCLGIYKDSVAFFTLHKFEKHLEIWTLNEGLWTKKCNIGPLLDIRIPLGHWNNDNLILEGEDRRLVLLDPDEQQIMDLAYWGQSRCQGIFTYMESLVSIKKMSSWGQDDNLR